MAEENKNNESEIEGLCLCGRPLIPCYNFIGIRIGVTHTSEDEDWHLEYWSTERIKQRIISN